MRFNRVIVLLLAFANSSYAQLAPQARLTNDMLRLNWEDSGKGYKIKQLSVKGQKGWHSLSGTLGQYTLLYSADQPRMESEAKDKNGKEIQFPEPEYRYIIPTWKANTSAVSLNKEGRAISFYPQQYKQVGNTLVFQQKTEVSTVEATWKLDPVYKNDLRVSIKLTADKDGYYSIASPALNTNDKKSFEWGCIPGVFQGSTINSDFTDAYAYGHGIPDRPVVVRERTAAALTAMLTNKEGITLAVTAEPGTGRDPWESDKSTQSNWLLGLSLINRQEQLSPTLYHPVLGQQKSYLKKGESISFDFRYTINTSNWYPVYQHVVNDVYRFDELLHLKQTSLSLSDRMEQLLDYVKKDSTSRWRTFDYNGRTIGAQEYLGGVHGSEKDAVKNADYGAMWMLANITKDPILVQKRLKDALNFKLAQQNTAGGFFNGAAAGQYYLYKSKRFAEEWGPYTEPIATTYYVLLDMGNVSLFEPDNQQLKSGIRMAADWLLAKMKPEGYWEVAYHNDTQKPMFEDLKDYRPTFYGLLVAYQTLRDKKYLEAAVKAADWYIKNAVDKGYFLGVCGDARFAPDFATGQSAQALLDLYEITKDVRFKQAAIKTAQFYTTSIYSHPIPNKESKKVGSRQLEDWQISQVGLSFEHGGILGSANNSGPIMLASHAGMFVRLFQLTKDSLYLKMARTAALSKDAFVDPATGVASYYWSAMNKGAGPFPHHAWWQVGWITDYLMAELSLRSQGRIDFPSGFLTPKVGPHKTFGFRQGKIFDKQGDLTLMEKLVSLKNPNMDYVCALNKQDKVFYLFVLNNDDEIQESTLQLDLSRFIPGHSLDMKTAECFSASGSKIPFSVGDPIKIAPYGLQVYSFTYK
ncbi:glycerophosphoryl diester phosphodiesterase [Pedobacter hiemivivus]|uniref:Glycerophosphoryl diester phosphodiesterase n=1 Tax=Pedobacter hiemivivus TaxID=2530454 RepID=A0A4U1GLS3_9SPHI|nr:glycerophosphoryl diester phosphodiesterase [Pedobacter hiemivivus]TKC65218.1 glycerophosphoryl diester phosphodiesterase [Pedobacter hiemivivus]